MSAERAAVAADTARGAALPSPPGFDGDWAHPVLGRMWRGQQDRQRMDRLHPWVLDTAVVLFIVCAGLPDVLRGGSTTPFGDTGSRSDLPPAVLLALTVALAVPLWWRRRAPVVTFFVIAVISTAQWALGVWLPAGISALLALYTLARQGPLRVLGWAVAAAAANVVLAVSLLAHGEQHPLLGAFFMLGTVTAATAVGLTFRIREMYLAALEDRARRLEIEQEQRLRLTAAAERSRVAREMHDIVGHNLSVMVSVADGAATLAAGRDERSAEALRILGDTGRQAMSELRRVLGVLREERYEERGQEGERLLGPQPGVRELDPLLARVRAAGVPVTYRTVGDLDALGDGVQLTVYRIVQEALTNTLKHAGSGTSAEVALTAEGGEVRIRVTDTGPGPGAPGEASRTGPGESYDGHGLVGIRQRAAMYGGTVVIGPRDTGHGWLVDVVLDVPPGDGLP
ncbi:histidine kinase [Streptomyces sp. NPDC047072]|uniref:sensor histidine kinase n=1 Tax=Streptomyces sp. NPDC047072 TaxID=3154809 RepID=UPI0034003C3A